MFSLSLNACNVMKMHHLLNLTLFLVRCCNNAESIVLAGALPWY